MKKIQVLILVLMFWGSASLFAQDVANYRVVRVVGKVESSKLMRLIKTEDVIPEGDKLKFESKQDYLIVFHPKQGRKRIQGIPDSQPREFDMLLQSFVKPDERSTGTRGGSDQAYIDKLKTSLEDTVLILGNGALELESTGILLNAPASIKAEYKTKDKKSVVLTVSSGQLLHLDKKTLFPDGQIPSSKVLLLYFLFESSNILDAETFLGSFIPKYIDDEILLPEIRTIVKSLNGRPPKETEKEIFSYLSQEYSKPQPMQLHSWLKTNRLLNEP